MGEVGALILVTCFPVLPRFMQILSGKRTQHSKSNGYPSIELGKGTYMHASDRTALTDPERGKDVVTGNVAAAWSGKGHKLAAIANPNFQEMLDAETLGGKESLTSISEDSVSHATKVPVATMGQGVDGFGGDGKIKRTVRVDLSTQACVSLCHIWE